MFSGWKISNFSNLLLEVDGKANGIDVNGLLYFYSIVKGSGTTPISFIMDAGELVHTDLVQFPPPHGPVLPKDVLQISLQQMLQKKVHST